MRWVALLSVLCGCFGLGGGSSEPPNPLAETQWSAPITGFECVEEFVFPDRWHYTYGVGCVLIDGSLAVQIISGTYTVDSDTLNTVVTDTSCPSSEINRYWSLGYVRSGDTLSLITSSSVIVLERVYPSGGSGSAAFGCFDANLSFTPMAVHPY